MKEFETIKTYGKVLNVWKHMATKTWNGKSIEVEETVQRELSYKEYNADGELISKGSEDFSPERENNSLVFYRIFTWDGERYNKGGNRWFDEALCVKIDRKDRKKLTEIAAKWFPQAAAISIR